MSGNDRRRLRITVGGPLLIEGPVSIELPSGEVVESDRFMVAATIRCATPAIGAAVPQGNRWRNDVRPSRQHPIRCRLNRSSRTPNARMPNTTSGSSAGSRTIRSATTSLRTTCSCTASASTCSR